jgi:hypothetical protein
MSKIWSRELVTAPCLECGFIVKAKPGEKYLREKLRKGRAYCSEAHRDVYVSRLSSERMAKTNRKHASARMKANNPMKRASVRKKLSASLRTMGWKPSVRGGNGKPLPVPQQLLALSLRWPTEVVIATKKPRGSGYPRHYKLDIADGSLKVAIEVDGNSHYSRRMQDRRKDDFLRGLGWNVLRFSNRQVMEHLEECVQMVLSTISRSKTRTPTSRTGS